MAIDDRPKPWVEIPTPPIIDTDPEPGGVMTGVISDLTDIRTAAQKRADAKKRRIGFVPPHERGEY